MDRHLPSSGNHEVNFNLVGNQDPQHVVFDPVSQPVVRKIYKDLGD